MLHPSTQKLIDRLAAMTAQKKIDWIEKDNGDVLYSTEGYMVRLTPEPARVLLSTDSGKALEDVTSTVLKATPHAEGGTYGDLVASIARDACREARGTEAAINTLLAGLSEESEAGDTAKAEPIEADDSADSTGDDALAVSGGAAGTMEDAGDDTTALQETKPEKPEPEAAMSADEPETGAEETAGGSEPAEADEDLVDVSVPEAALTAYDDDSVAEDEYQEAEAEAGGTSADTAPEPAAAFQYETADEDASADDEVSGTDVSDEEISGSWDDSFALDADDEDDVSGAVARLADEVNAGNSLSGTGSEAETAPAAEADGDTLDDIEETPSLTPAYSVPPGRYAPFGLDEQDGLSPEAAAPGETGMPDTPLDLAAGQEAPAVEEAATEDAEPETHSFAPDTSLVPEEATASDETETPGRSEEVNDGAGVETTGTASVLDESPMAAGEAGAEDSPAHDAEVTSVAPVWDEAPSGTDEAEPLAPETAFAEQAEDVPGEPAPVAQAETAPGSETAPDGDNVIRYVPFGTYGLEAAGADASDEAPVEEEVDSEIAAAAPMMTLPDEAAQDAEAPRQETTAETGATAETDPAEEAAPAAGPAYVSADADAPAAPAAPAEPQPVSLSLSGLSAGLGFGTMSGFTPTSPRPAGEQRASEESASRTPVYIDATDDYPAGIEDSATSTIPDVTNLPDDEAEGDKQHFVEASVADEDLDAVSPPSDTARQTFEHALSDVGHDDPANAEEQEEPETAPSRPKTRFNPWT